MPQDTLLGTDVLRLVQPPSQFMFLCIVKSLFFFLSYRDKEKQIERGPSGALLRYPHYLRLV